MSLFILLNVPIIIVLYLFSNFNSNSVELFSIITEFKELKKKKEAKG